MTQYRSARYQQIAAEVAREYSPAKADRRLAHWWKQHGRKWRNRVGYPRLTAEGALIEALGLVQSINRGMFRNRPDELAAYDRAVESLSDLTTMIGRENWRLFKNESRDGEVSR